MSTSRIKNTKRNILSGGVKQIVHLLMNFAIRTAIIYILGAEYQGLNGLFTSILQVLNLTDLGFSTAVTYLLYRPIAENRNDEICSIIHYLKKMYFKVGIIIIAAGLCITPFLKLLIHSEVPSDINIYALFLIFLFNAAISYLMFAYKSTLLSAMQREDVVSNAYTISTTAANILQLIVLYIFRNYYAFIIVLPLGTIANSLILQLASRKMFPEIHPVGQISDDSRLNLNKQVKAVFIGRIGDVARNSFDNIVISIMFGLVAVTAYGNYYYVFTAVYGLMNIIIHGIMASVGNSIAVDSVEKNYSDMQLFNFIFMWIVGWCSICMLCLYQPFMAIWMRNKAELMLSDLNMVLFCVYFYAINMTYVRSMYLDGNGLFYECRVWFIAEALANLALNFILGFLFGITGIIIATIITILVLNFFGRNHVLFKHYFKKSSKQFYFQHALFFVVTAVAGIVTYYACSFLKTSGVLGIILRLAVCMVVPNILMIVIYCRYGLFKQSLSFVSRVIKRR